MHACPQAVVFPENTEEVSRIVRAAAAHRTPVLPFGAGTRWVGSEPRCCSRHTRYRRMRATGAAEWQGSCPPMPAVPAWLLGGHRIAAAAIMFTPPFTAMRTAAWRGMWRRCRAASAST